MNALSVNDRVRRWAASPPRHAACLWLALQHACTHALPLPRTHPPTHPAQAQVLQCFWDLASLEEVRAWTHALRAEGRQEAASACMRTHTHACMHACLGI